MLHSALGLGLGAWALGLGVAAVAQRRLIFKPPTHVRELPPGPHAGHYGIETLALHVAPGAVLQGWRSTPLQGPARGTLLYFGGRGENVAWAPHMASYLGHWSVMAFNYRGFGASTGQASEAAVLQDAHRIFDAWVPPHEPVVLMGRSLGTAVALRLASQVAPQRLACQAAPQRLVLVSPFLSLVHLARARPLIAPAARLLRHRLDSTLHAPRVSCPTLVLMAQGDRQVPEAHSLQLARRLGGPVTLVRVAGQQHRTLPRCVATQGHVARFVLQDDGVPPG